MAKTNLAVRLLTSAVVAPLLLLVMFVAPPWAWFVVVAVACFIAGFELFEMTHPGDRIAQSIHVALTLAVSAGLYFFTTDSRVLLSLIFGVPILGALVPLWRLGKIETAAFRLVAGIAGPFYVGGLLTTIGLIHRDMGPDGPEYVVMTLMFAWLGDTGGYFFGRFLGKAKLYEAISPKKTRMGLVGVVVGSTAGALMAHFWFLPTIPLGHVVILAVVCAVLGQMGDLVESLLKRSTGIKDSGWIIPGHGGILDRIDALLVASPIVYLYVVWVGRAGQ